MKKPILVRKQAGSGGIMYTREVGGRGQGGLTQDLAAVRGGARGLVNDPNTNNVRQGFIPGAQLGAAKPTGMQRLAAGANIAGRGLAAALTGLQTAYGLQGGNVGALGSVGDTYAQNVQGLTANRPTEAQQAQDMATDAFNQQQQTMAQNAVQQSAQQIMNQPVNVGSSSSRGPAPAGLPTQQPTQPPAGLPAPPVPAAPAAPAQAAPAAPAAPNMTDAAEILASTNFNPQQGLTPQQTNDVRAAADLLGSANLTHDSTRTSGQGNPIPVYSGPMPLQQPAAPAPVVDNGLTPTQYPVLMPQQQTHEQQRQQVVVKPPVATPYTPQNPVNPFAADKKPGHAYNTGEYAPTQRQHGLSDEYDYRNRAMPANFDNISWDSAEPSLGDDPSINWDEFKRAFVSQVFDEFGDMLHKADPHTVGAVVMRVFLEKMLRK